MELPYFHVDAFTARAFEGNPAAVVLLPSAGVPDSVLAAVARELNLSETAFVAPLAGAGGSGADAFGRESRFGLRWFTPTTEVALCGHATLATAHVLFEHMGNTSPSVVFETLSGELGVSRRPRRGAAEGASASAAATLAMRFPHNPPTPRPWGKDEDPAVHELVLQALAGLPEPWTPDTVVHSVHYNASTKKLIIRLVDAAAPDLTPALAPGAGSSCPLLAIRPDPAALLRVDQSGIGGGQKVTGVSVTVRARPADAGAAQASAAAASAASSPSPPDFLSRYFSPWNGIPEDPVNGSSHTILGPYWAHELGRMRATGDEEGEETEEGAGAGRGGPDFLGTLVGRMASSRGGTLVVTVGEGVSGDKAWVELAGEAATVAWGTMRVPRW